MVIDLKTALSQLPLPATSTWPEGVWDKTLFEYGTMSVIVFTPRGHDYQTKHSQDELYIVIKGSGTLMVADTPHTFCERDVLFVPAEKQHRFVDLCSSIRLQILSRFNAGLTGRSSPGLAKPLPVIQ